MNAVDLKELIKKEGLESLGLYYGIYKGQVVENEDPDFRGRLKIKCPAVHGNKALNKWALSRGMYAGNGAGFYFLPQPGDPVWITFEGGDTDFPVWEYGWFPTDKAPADADHNIYTLQTPGGHRFVIDEENSTIYIQYTNGQVIEVNENNISLGTLGGSAEKAVLGDTLKSRLESLIDEIKNLCTEIQSLTVTCPPLGGPSTPPINAAQFAVISQAVDAIKNQLGDFLSDVVTLD